MYIGQLNEEGKPDGLGQKIWKSGARYDGYWRNDERQGSGAMQTDDKSFYIGKWGDDMKDGYGAHFTMEGHVYIGDFRDDKMHG